MPLLQSIKSLVSRLKQKDTTSPSASGAACAGPANPTPAAHSNPPRSHNSDPGGTNDDAGKGRDSFNHPGGADPFQAYFSTGLLSHSRNTLIRDSSLINVEHLVQIIESSKTALHLLEQKRTPGAEVDSSDRDDPPRCHPDTRKELRHRITAWLSNLNRDRNMLWILGPAGVGKSAVAQTIAEQCNAAGSLGAAFFFSRLNNRDNPHSVIPTIAYQLAIRHSDYKRLITQRLADNPTLLEKNLRTQFKELIIEPFRTLMMRDPSCLQHPLLIVLDGLDECRGKKAQCEFIYLISEHVRLIKSFPLIWMICSRPEWHFKAILANVDFYVHCQRGELPVDDDEAQQDVYRFLQHGFKEIRETFWDVLDDSWPLEAHVRLLAKVASGLFIFASTILRFVGDQDEGNPRLRLEICIRFVRKLPDSGAVNPLHSLDLLYKQILSDIPRHILSTTMRIIRLSILNRHDSPSACTIANVLCLDQGTFYAALQRLHSVLDIPTPNAACRSGIRFYHASFGDFLKDSNRSGIFSLDQAEVRYDIAIHCLRWYNFLLDKRCDLEDRQTCCAQSMSLSWISESVDSQLEGIHNCVANAVWKACAHVDIGSGYDARIVAELGMFGFCHLQGGDINDSFNYLLEWLEKWQMQGATAQGEPLLRWTAKSEADNQILEKYESSGGDTRFSDSPGLGRNSSPFFQVALDPEGEPVS